MPDLSTSALRKAYINEWVRNSAIESFTELRMNNILISLNDAVDLVVSGGGGEPTIAPGTITQYWRGDKTWQTLNKTAVGLSNVQNVDQTNATNLTSGTIDAARYGALTIPISAINATGTPNSSVFLRGDGTWTASPAVTDGDRSSPHRVRCRGRAPDRNGPGRKGESP